MQPLRALAARAEPYLPRAFGLLVFTVALLIQGRSLTRLVPDDGTYSVVGLGLANGRLAFIHLPGAPLALGIGPVYPAMLAVVWRVWAAYPGNQALATLIDAACLSLAAVVMQRVVQRLAAGQVTRLLAVPVGFLAFPLLAVTSTRQAVPEFLLLAAIVVTFAAFDPSLRRAALAGVVAGCAAMTLAAGVGLVVGLGGALLRRDRRAGLTLLGAAAATMTPWLAWTAWHRSADLWFVPRFWAGGVGGALVSASHASAVVYGGSGVGFVLTLLLLAAAGLLGLWRANGRVGGAMAGAALAAALLPRAEWTVWIAMPWIVIGLALAVERLQRPARIGVGVVLLAALALPAARQVSALAGGTTVQRAARAAQNADVLVTALNVEHPPADVIMTSNEARFFLSTGRRTIPAIQGLSPDETVRRACAVRVGLIAVPDSAAPVAAVASELLTAKPAMLEPLFALPQGPALYRLQCPS